ncbi:MAG: hypothetical protein D6755_06375, partial [Anaerolineae bacterium]
RACTHAILLYKAPEGSAHWEKILQKSDVPIVARLESIQTGTAEISAPTPYLQGRISGLDRKHPKPDLVFGALLERVAGLFHYQETYLERIHLRYAQYPPLSERRLMQQIDTGYDGLTNPWWNPEDLPAALACIPAEKPLSLYGRGPIWLAAAISAHTAPASMTVYDACFGWLPLPNVTFTTPAALEAEITPLADFDLAELRIPGIVLDAEEPLTCTPLPADGARGLVLSGKLPRWAVAGLVRPLQQTRPWVAIHVPKKRQGIVVASRTPGLPVGSRLPVPHPPAE